CRRPARRLVRRRPRRAHERTEEGEVPRDEEQHSDDARLGADLGVVRLAGLEPDVEPRRRRPGVSKAVALRMLADRPQTVAEVDEVAVERRLARRERTGCLLAAETLCVRLLLAELRRREVRPRR